MAKVWCNPEMYHSVQLSGRAMKTEEYNELVNEILHLTSLHNLLISNLESLFKTIIDDVKDTIVSSGRA